MYTSQGIPLQVVEREARELAERQQYMEGKVRSIVKDFSENDFKERTFTFIMANYFYKTVERVYPPAEIAAAKFNFSDGNLGTYHTYVNPGAVAMGYAYDAREHSEKTHRLPLPPDAMGERNYERLYAGILDLLDVRVGQTFSKDDPRRPCVFTRKQDVEMMESILDQLSNQQWRETFDVFHLELLFHQLKNKVETMVGRASIPITITSDLIAADRYAETPNISCDFHENAGATRHCALSYVTRWFYLFADHICVHIGVRLEAGRHLPANAAVEPPPPFEDDAEDDGNGAAGGARGN